VNKKLLVVFTAFLIIAIMATPLALANPGAEKNNEKFEYFELLCSGEGDGVMEREWSTTNPHLKELELDKTYHTRGGGWITGDTVELTVGSDTYTMTTTPVSVEWTTTTYVNAIWNNTGPVLRYNIKLTDVVTVYEDSIEVGTLILELKSTIVPGRDPIYSGVIVGYGTGALKGVKISGMDIGLVGAGLFLRTGTIAGWPY